MGVPALLYSSRLDTHVFITDLTQQVAFAEVSKDRFTSHRVAALRG